MTLHGYVTAEITIALGMCIMRYLFGHGLLCTVCQYKLHLGKPRRVVCMYIMSAAMAAEPARRE